MEKIGEPEPNRSFKPIPSGFHSSPRSLRAAIKAMNSPLIEDWTLAHIDNFNNEDWTEECQGITTDGSFWYVISNNKHKRAVYKFSFDFNLIKAVVFPINQHIGHPAVWDGKIYVPVEPTDADDTARVLEIDTELSTWVISDLGENSDRDPPGKMPWCAINPWNSYLYSSVFDDVDCVSACDPNNLFSFKKTLKIEGEKINSVQGGCFSNNGHLYLTSDDSADIRGYSALNGKFVGSFKLDYGDGDEIEGLCIGRTIDSTGKSSFVHVIILDNESISRDDVYINHFSVPDPSVV